MVALLRCNDIVTTLCATGYQLFMRCTVKNNDIVLKFGPYVDRNQLSNVYLLLDNFKIRTLEAFVIKKSKVLIFGVKTNIKIGIVILLSFVFCIWRFSLLFTLKLTF